jgi:nicotinamidase-related amidase
MKSEGCVGSTARNSLKQGLKTILVTSAIGSNSVGTLKKNIADLIKKGVKTAPSLKDRPDK